MLGAMLLSEGGAFHQGTLRGCITWTLTFEVHSYLRKQSGARQTRVGPESVVGSYLGVRQPWWGSWR